MIDYRRLITDLLALALLAACVFIALSLYSFDPADPPTATVYPVNPQVANLCGPVGARVAHALRESLGLGAWLALAILALVDAQLFSRHGINDPVIRAFGWLNVVIAVCAGLQVIVPGLGPVVGGGGYVGAWSRTILAEHFSIGGGMIVIATLICAGLLMSGDLWVLRLCWKAASLPLVALAWPFYGEPRVTDDAKPQAEPEPEETVETRVEYPEVRESIPLAGDEPEIHDAAAELSPASFKVNPPLAARLDDRAAFTARPQEAVPVVGLPELELLEESEEFPFELLAKKAQETAAIIERTFEEFGLNVKVAEVDTGPVVTQFELNLEPGLRVSKVATLADDLAIALRVPAVRVVSPIPGKNTVGVEVPNDKRVMVRLRELIEAVGTDNEKLRIPIYLGKDVSGRPLVVDLTKMPHLLIAGRTGTGKSVCLNTLILSMLMSRSPEDVRMLMIDPKMVELSPYMRIPHLMHPVITDMKKAEAVLAWAVDKMEERYDLLARVGVRHLDSYNKLGKEEVLDRLGMSPDDEEANAIPERMPYIVIIADELADMIMTSGKDVEGHIIRLAQKSRAVGIHLVLATQKPTVDVITGLIKSNLPARISFQVSSRVDSRVVLDECGAERLLGNGDMLYLAPGTSTLIRSQGTFVSDEEVNSVIDFFRGCPPQYSAEIAQATTAAANSGNGIEGIKERDDLYKQAVEIVIREGRGSVSLLQRAMSIGYGRAARIMDYMAEDGIVGDYNGSKSREVVMTMEQWHALCAGADVEEPAYA
ncbi:MAG: DNA translocase FtsK 4TM domain-containing protein [Planctomycetaceae bacterium]|nr:DNA translocase FtsK 4TM domain-containing protein [Planctomycetaceae bacterium]